MGGVKTEVDFRRFEPHRLLRSGHLQTLASVYVPRQFSGLPAGEKRLFRVDSDSQLLGLCHWQPGKPKDRPVVVTVHGLEGSCDSNYCLGIAEKAYARGFHAIRMNQRNCGGTEQLTPTLYNSGMSNDYRAILLELAEMDGFEQVFFAGYSMGGNLVSKMAGEWGSAPPKQLQGVGVVCPSMDLSACADALEKPENYFYERHFVEGLMTRYRGKAKLLPARYRIDGFGAIRTVREFDDAITAPCFGYRDAEEYYQAASAKNVVRDVTVPLLLITAKDDPFVPYASFLRAGVAENRWVQFEAPEHGGHCGFISRWSGAQRFWAEERIVEFFDRLRNNESPGRIQTQNQKV